jgi:hypothetical protein
MVEREPQEGIDWLRRGLAAYRATRTEAGRVFGLTALAGAHGKLRDPETALTVTRSGIHDSGANRRALLRVGAASSKG